VPDVPVLRLWILALTAGVAVVQTLSALPGWNGFWLVLPAWAFLWWQPLSPWPRLVVSLLAAFGLGFGYAQWRAEARLAEAMPPAWEGRDILLTGQVLGLPVATQRGQRVTLAVHRVHVQGARVPGRISLSLWSAPGVDAHPVAGGDLIQVRARLYRPQGTLNPGGFDYEAWLLERGIRAQGWGTLERVLAAPAPGSMGARLDAARSRMQQHLTGTLEGQPYAGVVKALALGDQDAITSEQWELFRRTGVTHLMSISGMHVTLLGWLAFMALAWGWRRVPGLALRIPTRLAAAWLALGVSAGYVLLSGWGIPAQRTLFMLLAATLALTLGRLQSTTRVLASALFLVVLLDPWAVLSVGFWLSFSAVALLIYAGAGRFREGRWWRAWVRSQWAVTLGLAPLLLLMFNQISLVSPLANALAIPLVSLLAVPLSILAALAPWDWPAHLAHTVLEIVMAGLHWLDRLPGLVWYGPTPTLPALVLAGLGVLLLLLPRGVPARWLGILLFLPMLLPTLSRPEPGQLHLRLLDVGQGLAILVSTHRHDLVYDAGPDYASGQDAGARIVAPVLHHLGIGRLSGLVVSHDDRDHSGGALSLLSSHAPAWLLSSLDDRLAGRLSDHGRAIRHRAASPILCMAGQTWSWDQVRFQVLYPPARYYDNPGFGDNDRSCVIRIEAAAGAVLLTGDLARLGEMTLVDGMPDTLAADILVVGHHGSASSTSEEFLKRVGPRHALISVGRRNSFGHPDPSVLSRLQAAGARVWRTDADGQLHLTMTRQGIDIQTSRVLERRYWHGR